MENFFVEYKNSSLMKKVGFWGSIASIIGIALYFIHGSNTSEIDISQQDNVIRAAPLSKNIELEGIDSSQPEHLVSSSVCNGIPPLFEKKKFIENNSVLFCAGKVSLSVERSDVAACYVNIYQPEKGEAKIRLVKGHPLPPFDVLGEKYIFHFIEGEYRNYSVISSYKQ